MDEALAKGSWLLGERFTTADVMLGSLLSIALFNRCIADPSAALVEYNRRLSVRAAYQRAAELTWPPRQK
jgi:glutathione S-transferase